MVLHFRVELGGEEEEQTWDPEDADLDARRASLSWFSD